MSAAFTTVDRQPDIDFLAVMEQLGDHGIIDRGMADRFVEDLEDAARRDRLFCALTMFAVFGRRPG